MYRFAGAAYNYGGMGAIIGHELTHAFDPNGMRFNELGKLISVDTAWYNPLREVVDAQSESHGENAKLTSAENVADVAGLRVAYNALRRDETYRGVMDDRVFFERWATTWASKFTEKDASRRLLVDPHAPGDFCKSQQNNAVEPTYKPLHHRRKTSMQHPAVQYARVPRGVRGQAWRWHVHRSRSDGPHVVVMIMIRSPSHVQIYEPAHDLHL